MTGTAIFLNIKQQCPTRRKKPNRIHTYIHSTYYSVMLSIHSTEFHSRYTKTTVCLQKIIMSNILLTSVIMDGSSTDLKSHSLVYTVIYIVLYIFLSKFTYSKSQPEPKCSFGKKMSCVYVYLLPCCSTQFKTIYYEKKNCRCMCSLQK